MKHIPYSRQDISEADIEAVTAVLRSDYITQGPAVPAFEENLSRYCNAGGAAAVATGTAALHLCMLALEAKRVWTSPISFMASANCALYVGAEIDFVDVEPETGNMSVQALAAKLAAAQKLQKLPDVVIPVHFTGRVCDMPAIAELAQRYKFKIVEDAAHALGATYPSGEPVGCGKYATATILSFHPVKTITTGEGGAVLSEDAGLLERIKLLRTHGITRESAKFTGTETAAWYYEQQVLGYHYRMTDMQAALGSSQLRRIDAFIARRREIADTYEKTLTVSGIVKPLPAPESAWHLYVIRCHGAEQRNALFLKLREQGIGVNVHYYPIHLQPIYRGLGFAPGQCPCAENFAQSVLSLPIYSLLTSADQTYVIESLEECIK